MPKGTLKMRWQLMRRVCLLIEAFICLSAESLACNRDCLPVGAPQITQPRQLIRSKNRSANHCIASSCCRCTYLIQHTHCPKSWCFYLEAFHSKKSYELWSSYCGSLSLGGRSGCSHFNTALPLSLSISSAGWAANGQAGEISSSLKWPRSLM